MKTFTIETIKQERNLYTLYATTGTRNLESQRTGVFFFGRGWDLGSVRFSGLPLVPRIKFEFVFYFIFFFFLDSGADSS